MSRKSLVQLVSVCVVMAFSVLGSGCKKEEKAPEAVPAAAPQAAAPAPSSTAPASAKEFTFEDGIGGWKPVSKTIKIEAAADKVHGGKGSLKISGSTGASAWNFAGSPKFALESGKKYRLSGWMMVEATSDPKYAPFLKCAINEGPKWLSNANTKKYNLSKLNEWQELSAEFTAPAGQGLEGYFAIEKGTNKADIKATIYIDDLKLEAL
jgi:hypothetical protein